MRYSNIIKKYNKNDSNNKRKNKDGGYTLVELLAIIVILSIIISIVVVVAINIVNKSREKSYRVTVNNIENVASSYAIENQSQYEWMDTVDSNNEYFCITVQDLIEKGYLKNNVLNSNISNDSKVEKGSYIYLERNKLSKSITKNLLLSSYGDEYNNYCNNYETGKDIEFIEEPTGWSREKKVIINYKIFNLKDSNISDYKYRYEFLVENKKIDWKNFNSYSENSLIDNITSNGVIKAYIMDKDDTIAREYTINSIDKGTPEIELSIDGNNIDESKKLGMEYAKNRNVTIKLVDDQSGLKKGSYTIKYDWSTSNKTCDQLTNDVVINVDDNNSSGKVIIADKTGKGKLYVCGEGITDNVGNVRGKEVENIDLYLDNVKPVISLGNYTGNSTVSKMVTIPILVTDNDSGVDRSSFITSDVVILIDGVQLKSGFELSSINSNNYNLVINNTSLNGNVVLKIKDGNVLDNVKNGNDDVELNTNITFNNTYLIKYDANGGSGAPSSQTKTYGVDLTLSSTKPTRTGYTFLGWSESSSATSATFASSAIYSQNKDVTLYAIWEKILTPVNSYKCANITVGSAPYLITYTGNCDVIDDGDNNWRIKLLTSGIFTSISDMLFDVFLVGGGGGGGGGHYVSGGGGGGGGYTNTSIVKIAANTQYKVTIGSGGLAGTAGTSNGGGGIGGTGGTTSAFGASAPGGDGGIGTGGSAGTNGGNGGSGGGGGASCYDDGGNGGSNGNIGSAGYGGAIGGWGQGSSTREFGISSSTIYSGGGGGGGGRCGDATANNWSDSGNAGSGGPGGGAAGGKKTSGSNAAANTGGGGGGGGATGPSGGAAGGKGGSGIVVIRNPRTVTELELDFEYKNGTYLYINDGNDNWRIKFLSSGTFIPKENVTIDAFLVGGGGGGGGGHYQSGGGGGAGGKTVTKTGISLTAGTSYKITIGAGGTYGTPTSNGGTGGTTSAFSNSATGGTGGGAVNGSGKGVGGTGGSGGGGGGGWDGTGGAGGSNGGNGTAGKYAAGTGQKTTTREFGSWTATIYAGGGGGGIGHADPENSGGKGGTGGGGSGGVGGRGSNGVVNTGGGGGGANPGNWGGSGGSGIVVIRNKR